MSRKKTAGVVVTVAEAFFDRLASLADELKKKGLHDLNVLDAIHLITGSIDPTKIDSLREVEGVREVLPDEEKRMAETPARPR